MAGTSLRFVPGALALAAVLGCSTGEPTGQCMSLDRADQCGSWCPFGGGVTSTRACGAEETCTRGACETLLTRPVWRLPPEPVDASNYVNDGETLLDRTTGLAFRLAPLPAPDDPATACEHLGHGFRLPQWIELQTIIDYTARDTPSLLAAFDQDLPGVFYWSVIGRDDANDRAHATDGHDVPSVLRLRAEDTPDGHAAAICVRATAPVPAIAQRFVLEGDAALDTITGLRWQRGASDLNGGTTGMGYASAAAYCTALDLGFAGAWRLPTLHELFSLREQSKYTAVADDVTVPVFDQANTFGEYWSSTPRAETQPTDFDGILADQTHWAFSFDESDVAAGGRRARCVLGPE